ncbi:MAG: hypothetical protein Q9222_007473 [Ikaeria aurantiellina]
MSVDPQADVGNLSLAGLGGLRSILATLSSDDIQPTAVLQVQGIGSLFHANGKFASTVSDELQRFSSYRLEKLSMTIGWRKGDAVSLLAQSTGGQAAALLALWLRNSFDYEKAGDVLFRLSQAFPSSSGNLASIKQLAEVVTKVSAKLSPMGYGNFLAEQVTKLRLVYLELNLDVPRLFLEDLSEVAAVELLQAISRAQRGDPINLRITGIRSVGHIMSLLLLLCADNVEISVENIVIHSGTKRCIFLDVVNSGSRVTRIRLETTLKSTEDIDLPISEQHDDHRQAMCRWNGWLAARLDLCLLEYGFVDRSLLASECCNFIWNSFQLRLQAGSGASTDRYTEIRLLGPEPYYRMRESLVAMFSADSWNPVRLEPIKSLEMIVNRLLSMLDCKQCRSEALVPSILEPNEATLQKSLPYCASHASLWTDITGVLADAFTGLFVEPGLKAAIPLFRHYRSDTRPWLGNQILIDSLRNLKVAFIPKSQNATDHEHRLGQWNGSSVFYPAILHHFKLPADFQIRYRLVDGCFMLNDRYYESINAERINRLPGHSSGKRSKGIVKGTTVRPAGLESSMELNISLTESYEALLLRTSVKCQGVIWELDLASIYNAYERLSYTSACSHSPDIQLEDSLLPRVRLPMDLFENVQPEKSTQVLLFMAHNDRRLQFLYSNSGYRRDGSDLLFTRDCCLNCAVNEAFEKKCSGLVVT